MFNSPVLDIVIILSFTYFMLALIVSSVNEFIQAFWRNKRPELLKDAISNLLFDTHWREIACKVLNNTHINVLKETPGKFPAYIPAESFAKALLDQFRSSNATAPLDMPQIQAILLNPNNTEGIKGELRLALLGLFERSDNDFDKFNQQIEAFYNNAMQTTSALYKKHIQFWITCIAAVVAISLNIDTLNIAGTLWSNPDALKQSANSISELVNQIEQQDGKFSITANDDKVTITGSVNSPEDTAQADLKKVKQVVTTTEVYLKSAGIPFGWRQSAIPSSALAWLAKVAGLLLTVFAISMGAPFWFDLLNKVVNLRGSGKKPEAKEDK
jgi:hypothetical protein